MSRKREALFEQIRQSINEVAAQLQEVTGLSETMRQSTKKAVQLANRVPVTSLLFYGWLFAVPFANRFIQKRKTCAGSFKPTGLTAHRRNLAVGIAAGLLFFLAILHMREKSKSLAGAIASHILADAGIMTVYLFYLK